MPRRVADDESFDEDEAWDDGPIDADLDDDDDLVPCPLCGEEIYEDTVRCPKCGNYVPGWRERSTSPLIGKPTWYVLLALMGIVAVLWIMMGFR